VTDCLVVTVTAPSEQLATSIAETIVAERLAACAQVYGPVTSRFWWQGRRDQATEWRCQLKTTRARFAALEARIRALHPYEVPEITAVPIVEGSEAYLDWLRREVNPPA
jgi:periplasmic divalent cation tolerance protein